MDAIGALCAQKSNSTLTRVWLDCSPHLSLTAERNMEWVVALVSVLLVGVTWLLFKLVTSLDERK
jgi:hypothetical protein